MGGGVCTAAAPLQRSPVGATVPRHGSPAPAATQRGNPSRASHQSGGADCGCLRAFQRQDGHPRCSSVRLHFVRAVLPFAEYLSMGAFFCAWGTAGFPVSPGSRLLSPPPLHFFSVRLALLGCTAGLHFGGCRLLPPPTPSGHQRSPGAAPVPSGSQLPASSPTALHQGGECRCGRSWLPYLAQHITAVMRHKGHTTSGTDARQE